VAPKKEIKADSSFTYEDAVKAIKSIKGSQCIIGDEIPELCTIKKKRTGIPTLDYLSSGGISEGRITAIGGKPSSSKTTSTLQGIVAPLIQEIKDSGEMKFGLYIDSEGGYDSPYARRLGVDEKYLIIKRKKVIEDAFQEIDDLISAGFIKFLVVDSLDTMVSKKGDDNKYAATMGGNSGALSQHLPVLYDKIMQHNVTTVFIKQARVKMGGYNPTGQELIQISGGYCFKHLCDSILIVNRLSNKNLTYTPIQLKGEKTRSSRLGLVMDMPLTENGIDVIRDAFNLAVAHKMITVAGAGWTSWQDLRAQGADNFIELIKSSDDLKIQLMNDVYDKIIFTSQVCASTTAGPEIITDLEDETKDIDNV
jgi:RecA/RadA recombinase